MFENIMNFFKKLGKTEKNKETKSKQTAKERLHLVLMQDRANVSADFLEMMKQEIIEVIKKYIEVDEKEIDVRLTNDVKEDGTTGAPSLYANIPIMNIKNEMKKEVEEKVKVEKENKQEEKQEQKETSEENKPESKEPEANTENEETKSEEAKTDIENKQEEDKKEEIEQEDKEEKLEEKNEENNKENNENKSGE